MAAAQIQPTAYCGCAPQRMMAECINPNQENSAATAAPAGGASEIAVDQFGEHGGDHKNQKQESVAEALHGSPVNRAVQRGLHLGIGCGKSERGKRGIDSAATTAPVVKTNPSKTALRYFGSTRRSVAMPTPMAM